MMRRRNRAGFTLVEIMIVVMIIGVLLAIAVPQWQKARERTRENSCVNNLRQVDNAKARWAIENREPGTATPVIADLAPDYIKVFPTCPAAGTYTIGTVDADTACDLHGTVSTFTP